MLRTLPLLALVMVAFGPARASASVRHSPTLAPANTVIDGPSPDITGLSAMAVARDGTGGVVYVKTVLGVPHVFLSRLLSGHFQPPQQVDADLPGPSSQPVIAASDPGQLLIAFINAGQLYTVQSANGPTPLGAPRELFAGASNPSISMSAFGKAYLAFTATDGSGSNVRTAFYYQGAWALESSPLNVTADDNAGTGTGRPDVATAGDGIAIVTWGENGHVYTRRVWGTAPSVVYEQADVPSFDGLSEVSADEPSVATGGNSSYAALTFQEIFADGSAQQSRVLTNRLLASEYDAIQGSDGITSAGAVGADQPQVVASEYGAGFVTSERQDSHDVYAEPLSDNEIPNDPVQVNSETELAAPDAVPATAGLYSTLIAFQQDPGSAGTPEVRVRYAPDGSDLGPEEVVSSPSLGPTDADAGLVAGGDIDGDAAIAWVQGSGASTQIVAAQLYQAPGGLAPTTKFRYSTSATPLFSWSAASEEWGPIEYLVTVGGVPVATTTATQIRPSAPLTNGRHSWQVKAVNPAGLFSTAPSATVFVDTVPPKVSLRITGTPRVGSTVQIRINATDAPPPVRSSDASGIKSVQLKWGDGTKLFIQRIATATHVYQHPGTYVVTVIAKDRAGNRTVVTRQITIKPKLKPTPKRRPK